MTLSERLTASAEDWDGWDNDRPAHAKMLRDAAKHIDALITVLEACKIGAEYPDELGDIIDAAITAARTP